MSLEVAPEIKARYKDEKIQAAIILCYQASEKFKKLLTPVFKRSDETTKAFFEFLEDVKKMFSTIDPVGELQLMDLATKKCGCGQDHGEVHLMMDSLCNFYISAKADEKVEEALQKEIDKLISNLPPGSKLVDSLLLKRVSYDELLEMQAPIEELVYKLAREFKKSLDEVLAEDVEGAFKFPQPGASA